MRQIHSRKKQNVPKALTAYIEQLIELFIYELNLQRFAIEWKWVDRIANPKGQPRDLDEPLGFSAEIDIEPIYYQAEIRLSIPRVLEKWKTFRYYDIADTICHELCHILTEELELAAAENTTGPEQEMIRRINEKSVCKITTVVLSHVDRAKWQPKTI